MTVERCIVRTYQTLLHDVILYYCFASTLRYLLPPDNKKLWRFRGSLYNDSSMHPYNSRLFVS